MDKRKQKRLNYDMIITNILQKGRKAGYFGDDRQYEIQRIEFIICAFKKHFSVPEEYKQSLKGISEHEVNDKDRSFSYEKES